VVNPVEKLRDQLKKDDEKAKKDGEEGKKEGEAEENPALNPRLYVMNLSFEVSHDELKELFGKYGEVESVEIPLRKGGRGQALGISYIMFKETEASIAAYASLDKTYY